MVFITGVLIYFFAVSLLPPSQTKARFRDINILYTNESHKVLMSPPSHARFKLSSLGVALGLALTGYDVAYAATEELVAEKELPAVTVLGSRLPGAPLSNVPASITVVSPEEIAKQQATAARIEDVITRTTPGFNPTNNGVRQIRGRTAQVFVNGVPVNEQMRASSGADINLLSVEQLSTIEVSRGANSAYGFGSPGGIIALTTPRAESRDLTFNTKLRTSVNTNELGGSHQTTLYQSVSRIVGAFDYYIGALAGYDGLEYDADGRLSVGSRGPSRIGNGKEGIAGVDWSFGYKLGEGELRLSSTLQRVDMREAYSSDSSGVYRESPSVNQRFPQADASFRRSQTHNLSYENARLGQSTIKLEALLGRTYTEAYDTNSGRVTRDEQSNDYTGFRSTFSSPMAFINQETALTYGFDFMRNRYFRPVYFTDTGEIRTFFSPDVSLDSYAPHAQLTVPLGQLRLTTGVRHEEYRGEVETAVGPGGIEGGEIKAFDITLFNLGLVYGLDKHHSLFATYSQGAEISQLGRAARGAGVVTNLNPQPAKSNQYELGFRRKGGGLDYSLAAFYTESDLMSALQTDPDNPDGPLIPLREPREFWGIEGTLGWRVATGWKVGGTFAWQDGERTTASGEKRDIGGRDLPPFLLAAYVDYAPTDRWSTTLQVDHWGSSDEFVDSTDFGEGSIDSTWLLHLSGTVKVGRGELRLGIRNLLNEEYYSLTSQADNSGFSWIPEEGRRVSLSYAVKW